MCFGGGPSAQKLYEEQKPEFGALPSLSMNAVARDPQRLKDVVLRGQKKRSLLNPMSEG